MADEKSIVKMNKMIHKKTGASFLVVYVIYVRAWLNDNAMFHKTLIEKK